MDPTSQLTLQKNSVDQAVRAEMKRQRPCLLWITGLSGAGKSTIADLVEQRLAAMGSHTYLLDGDNLRHGLCRDLGFSAQDRAENIRRVGEVGRLMVDAGLVVIAAFISPFRSDRDAVRGLFQNGEFIEIFVDTPLEECERRDPKGLYKKARKGEVRDFTGVDSPYEAPTQPEMRLDAMQLSPDACAQQVVGYLIDRGFLVRGVE